MAGIHPLISLWQGADPVARAAFVVLAALFLVGAYVWVGGLQRQLGLARQARTVAATFWTAPNLYEALKRLEPESAYRRIAQAGLEAATHLEGRLTDRIGTGDWIALSLDRAVREFVESLYGRLGILAVIAPAAVAVGLVGAVASLYGPFIASGGGRGGPGDPGVAIGEALMIGTIAFVVALPAAAGHGWLLRRNARVAGHAREFAAAIRALLVSADRSTLSESLESASSLPPRDRIRAHERSVAGFPT